MTAPRLCLITDRRLMGVGATIGPGDIARFADAIARALDCVPSGAAWIQIREKDLGGRALAALVRAAIAVTRPRGAAVIVNDRLDVALATAADGVHLPEDGLDLTAALASSSAASPSAGRRPRGHDTITAVSAATPSDVSAETRAQARRPRGHDTIPDVSAATPADVSAETRSAEGSRRFVVGCSRHAVEAVLAAARSGVDLVQLGPTFATPSKAGFGPPLGLAAIGAARHALDAAGLTTRLVAVGGIDSVTRAREARDAGAHAVAVIRAAWSAEVATIARALADG